MSDFMTPSFQFGKFYLIETGYGTECVPFKVCGEKCRSINDLKMYLSGDPYDDELPEPQEGWVYRMSADGYLDTTDWMYADSEIEMLEEILEYYGTGTDEENIMYDWEKEANERLAELKAAEENDG